MSQENQALDRFEEWLELLSKTNHMELLENPINVWVEAYTVGALFERHRISMTLQAVLTPPKMPEGFEGSTADMNQMLDKIRKIIVSVVHQVPSASMASEPQAKQ